MSTTYVPTHIPPTTTSKPVGRLAARIALGASVGAVLAIAVAGTLDPGYSQLSEGISAMASRESKAAPVMIVGFYLMAVTLVTAAVSLFRTLPRGVGRVGAVLVLLAGGFTAASGFYRQDCSSLQAACRAKEHAETVSGEHVLHNLLALPLFVFLVLAGFLFAAALRRVPALRSLVPVTVLVAITSVLLFVWFGSDQYGNLGGLVQRGLVLLAFGWPVNLANRLSALRQAQGTEEACARNAS